MNEQKVYLIDVVRTPQGKGRTMEKLLSSDLAAAALLKLLARTEVKGEDVDQVVFGQEMPTTYPNNIGHFSWLKARLPEEVPGYTVQSNTASGLQALRNAYYLIASGNENCLIAGSADSYSAAPFVMRDVRNHFYEKDRYVRDTIAEADTCTQPEPLSSMERYRLSHGEGVSREAKKFQADDFANARRFAAAYSEQIAPVSYIDRKKGEIVISDDGWLAGEVREAVLAPCADGAAAAMLASQERAAALGVKPTAEVLGFAVSGGDTKKLNADAAVKLLKRKGLTAADITWAEIEELSAEDTLDAATAIGIPVERVNPYGGALSYGRCGGGEGLAMLQRLNAALEAGQYGLLCISSSGGQSMAALIKKV